MLLFLSLHYILNVSAHPCVTFKSKIFLKHHGVWQINASLFSILIIFLIQIRHSWSVSDSCTFRYYYIRWWLREHSLPLTNPLNYLESVLTESNLTLEKPAYQSQSFITDDLYEYCNTKVCSAWTITYCQGPAPK